MTYPARAHYRVRAHPPRPSRRVLLHSAAAWAGGGIAAALAGCSGTQNGARKQPATPRLGSGGATPSIQANTPVLPRTSLPAENYRPGGVIQGAVVAAGSLDPVANFNYLAQGLAGFHYSRLFRFNSGPDPQASLSREPIPDLVDGYEVSEGGLTYTLKLRQNVNFHPPLGRRLTSSDVKASWDNFTSDQANSNRSVYAPIVDSLAVPDSETLVFTLKRPFAPFLNMLADPSYLWIMSQEVAANGLGPSQQPAGTGPWIFSSQSPTAFNWKRNPDYFLNDIPYADGAQLNIIGDIATQESQFRAGKLDLLTVYSPTDVFPLQQAVPAARLAEYVGIGLSFLFFSNVQDPNSPFQDPRMRQAASIAIDRKALIDSIYFGRAVMDNIIPPGLGKWWLDPQSKAQGQSAKWFSQDLQSARQLLTASGHLETQLKFLYTNNAYGIVFQSTADAIGRMLTSAGFKITTVTVDYAREYINDQGIFLNGAPPNTIVFASGSIFNEPDGFLTNMLTRDGSRNHDLMNDPELEAQILKQRQELDEGRRLQLIYDIQRLHAEKMYYPPLVYTRSFSLQQPWVQNFFVADDYNYGTEQYAYVSVNNR